MGNTIPVTIRMNVNDVELKEMELEENLQRESVDWTEESEGMRLLEELKRGLYGTKTQQNPDGWSQEKTAEIAGQTVAMVSRKLTLAEKLKKRPELKSEVAHLPFTHAEKRVKQIEEHERAKRLVESGNITLRSELRMGSCIELLPSLPEASVDLILTDPPFGLDEIEDQRETRASNESTTQVYTSMLTDDDNLSSEKALELLSLAIPQISRVLKPGAHFYIFFMFNGYTKVIDWLRAAGLEPRETPIIWDKMRQSASFTGYDYMSRYEGIIHGFKPPRERRLNTPAANILSYATLHSSKKIHPFEKPQELLQFLIKQSTTHGQMVCDPFAGSAATLEAGLKLGRSVIGFEKNSTRFHAAQARLSLVKPSKES